MKITFKECNIPLTRDNLIKISEEIGEKFYAKTIKTITYKHSWDKEYDSVTNRVEPIVVHKTNTGGHFIVKSHDLYYENKEEFDNESFIMKTVIVGLCPIEFDVNEDWNVDF